MTLPVSPPLAAADVVTAASPSGRRILDVGCGDGELGAALLAAGAAEVVGLDACARGLTRSRLTATYRAAADAAPELPYPNGYFDVVLVEDFSALQAPGPALRHLRRWLADDGRLVVVAPNSTHEAALVALLGTGHWPPTAGLRPSTVGQLLEVLEQEGFKAEDEVTLQRTEAGEAAPLLKQFAEALGADPARMEDGLTLVRAVVGARPTGPAGGRADPIPDPWRGSRPVKVLVAPDIEEEGHPWVAAVEDLAKGLANNASVTLAITLPTVLLSHPPEVLVQACAANNVDMVLIEAPEDDSAWARLLAGASTWVVTTPEPTLVALARQVGVELQIPD